MKVILTNAVTGVGAKGDVVDVSAGYARNFLMPKKLAIKASDGALKQAENLRRAHEEAEKKVKSAAESIKAQLTGTRVVIAAQASDEGQLFGSIGSTEIVEAVEKLTGVALERRSVALEAPVKSIGLHVIPVRLHPEVELSLTVDVIPA
jgi:large subunit ribosomal protein L9